MTWADVQVGDSIEGKGRTEWWVTAARNKDKGKIRVVTIERGDKQWTLDKTATEEVTRIHEAAPKVKGVDEHDLAVATVQAGTPSGAEVIATVGPGDNDVHRIPPFKTPSTYLAHLLAYHGIKDPKLGDPRHVHEGGPGYTDHTHEETA